MELSIFMQAASSPAKEKAELAEKQAELDRALHSYRSGNLSAEKARQIIAQVLHPPCQTPHQGPSYASVMAVAHAPVILTVAAACHVIWHKKLGSPNGSEGEARSAVVGTSVSAPNRRCRLRFEC